MLFRPHITSCTQISCLSHDRAAFNRNTARLLCENSPDGDSMLPTNHHHRATRRNFWFQKNLFAQTTKRKSNRSTKFTKRKSHNLFEIFYSIHRTRLTLYSMIERYLQFVRAKCAKIQITLQSRSNSSSSVRPRFGPPRARIVMYSYTNLQKWNEHQSVKLYSHFVQCRDMYLVNVRRG